MKRTTFNTLSAIATSFFVNKWSDKTIKEHVCSTMEEMGFDTFDTKHSIQIAPNWSIDLNCSSLMPAKMVKKNIVEFMENLFNSVPNEYQFCNLTSEKAIELGFCYSDELDLYDIPLWYWNLIPVGTKLYDPFNLKESTKIGNEDTDDRGGYIYWTIRL